MRILITGSRDLTDANVVVEAITNLSASAPVTIVVGDCPTGADLFARGFWGQIIADRHHPETPDNLRVFKADWQAHGKAAGPLRNQAMVDSGADVCLAFYKQGAGNRGTSDCVTRARAAGIPVKEFTE